MQMFDDDDDGSPSSSSSDSSPTPDRRLDRILEIEQRRNRQILELDDEELVIEVDDDGSSFSVDTP